MTTQRQLTEKLTARQQAILEFIRVHQPVSIQDIAERFGIANNTAGVHLQAIRAKQLIWSSGNNRWARWHSEPPFSQAKVPEIKRASIEQVSSIWHYAQRCARHHAAHAKAA